MCFWGWIWFGRKYPSANFPRPLAARRQTFQAGHLLGRNLRTSITTNKIYVFSLEPARWDQETAHRRCQLGGGRGRNKGDTSAVTRRLPYPQCAQFAHRIPKSQQVICW